LTLVSYLDLLVSMAKDGSFEKAGVVVNGRQQGLSKGPLVLGAHTKDVTLKADRYTVVRVDRPREVNMLDFTERTPFFEVRLEKSSLEMGDEVDMVIELKGDAIGKDNGAGRFAEYYAIVAVPSTLSVKQTEDLLSDYKGQLIYGQRESGSQKIQLLAVPFRGSKRIVLKLGAAQKGASDGYVLVRHIENPDIVSTVKTGMVTVK
jgi:hypothetical protein